MRITNGMMITSSLSNLNGALTRVAKYNNQLASNRKILTLSDSPVGVLNSMGARTQIRRLEQYQRNVDASRSWIQQAESAVTEMEELTISIRELLTDSMGTENAEDKAIFATQLRQYTHSLLELCNSSNGSQYMFGGYNVTQQPFTATYDDKGNIIGVKYNGLDLTGLNVEPSKALSSLDKLLGGADGKTPIADKVTWGGNMTLNGTYVVGDVVSQTVPKRDADGNPVLDADGNPVMETIMTLQFKQVQDNQFAPDGKTPAYPDLDVTPAPDPITVTVNLSEALKDYDGSDTKIALNLVTEDGESFGTISMNVPKNLSGLSDTASNGKPLTGNDALAAQIGSALTKAIAGATEGGAVPTPAAMANIVDGGTTYATNVSWNGPTTLPGEFIVSFDGISFTFMNKDEQGEPKSFTMAPNIASAISNAGEYKGEALNISIPLAGSYKDANGKDVSVNGGTIQMQISATSPQLSTDEVIAGITRGLQDTNYEIPTMSKPPVVIQSASVSNAAATTGPKTPSGLNWTGSIRDTSQKYTLGVETNQDGRATGITFTNSYGSVVYTAPVSDISSVVTGEKLVGLDGSPLQYVGADGTKTPIVGHENTRYTLDLSKEGYGVVTWTTQDMIDQALKNGASPEEMAKKVMDQGFPTSTDLANFVASAEYVASNIGNEASQRLQFEVGHNIMTDVTFTGIDLVGTGEDNLFKIMIDLADMLDNNARNEDLTVYITKLTQKQDQLLTAMVKSGNRDNKMTTMANRYKLDAINYEANRSNIEDIDQAEVITQMKFAEVIYKQALAASAQIIQPTLMDFLR